MRTRLIIESAVLTQGALQLIHYSEVLC